ncbi:hypothetical protein BDZ90DRAFT_232571 [Jaminaea rosea]|uniref:Uncharacterized protein n=1 Tax=Jaminaea rosea TaxID=1569628 RepID=A0A316UNV8_9BASI|nr:hypothetical protein BDZ90DRAFT_232571 [Jaminaea rosea]PWN26992.1 hypothetical protein BDZ90DRAFT_232571 [Jaminaea rosea]
MYNFTGVAPVHRALCGVRLDNSLSFASPSPYNLPPTCFNDVVLVPLASWIFYIALLAWIIAAARVRSSASPVAPLQRYRQRSGVGAGKGRGHLARTKTAGVVIYTLLIIASLLMNILEIVRLALVKPNTRGVGLLPFTLASILIVLIIIHIPLSTRMRPWTSAATLLFWCASIAMTSVKLRVLALMMEPEPRYGSEYLDSDQQIDVGVIVGLYAIFVIVEVIRMPMAWREARRPQAGGAGEEDKGSV